MNRGNRSLGLWCLTIFVCMAVLGAFSLTAAEAKEKNIKDGIKIAVIYPMSGALARNGNLSVQSVKAAMGWVNDTGGIRTLGGAKLVPVVADCGSSVEKVASAYERVLKDPDIVAVIGSWASSFTMSGSEITERMGVPHFAFAFADSLHQRGFKYGFYVIPPSSTQGEIGLANVLDLARSAGDTIKTAMFLGDNQAASKGFYDACRKLLPGLGVKIVAEEIYSMGTLTDATPVLQKVKTTNPDLVMFMATAIAEAQMCLMKKKELGITTPFVGNGGWLTDPSYAKVGAEVLEGIICILPIFENKNTPKDWMERALAQCKKEYSDEPWAGQELGSFGFSLVPALRLVLEKAASTDPEKILKARDEGYWENVPETAMLSKNCLKFGKDTRIHPDCRGVMLVQWQKGVPRTIYPADVALAKPMWVKKK